MNSGNSLAAGTTLVDSSSLGARRKMPCNHDVQFYFDDHFLITSLAEFLKGALHSGSSAIVVATPGHRNDLAEQLRTEGLDLPLLSQQGRFVSLDAAETLAQFTAAGSLDENLFQELVGNLI